MPLHSLKNSQAQSRPKKLGHPPRPRRPISYNLPKNTLKIRTEPISGGHGRPKIHQETTESPLVQLSRVRTLLELIRRRHKNQHRNQSFFKWLNLLRSAVAQLINLHLVYESAEDQISKPTTNAESHALSNPSSRANTVSTAVELPMTSEAIRRKFEQQSEIRSQREFHENWVRETLVPNAYIAFSSFVANQQFANIGLVLVGVLSDITRIVGLPQRIDHYRVISTNETRSSTVANHANSTTLNGLYDISKHAIGTVETTSTIRTGQDSGEITEREYENEIVGQGGQKIDSNPSLSNYMKNYIDIDVGIPLEREEKLDILSSVKVSGTQQYLDESTQSLYNVNNEKALPTYESSLESPNSQTATDNKMADILQHDAATNYANTTADVVQPTESYRATKSIHRGLDRPREAEHQKSSASSKHRINDEPRTKRKKKKTNAIDDLFSGFG